MTFAKLEFSPRTLPAGDHIEAMKDYLGRELIRLDIHLPENRESIDYRLGLHTTDRSKWGHWSQLPVIYERSDHLRQDGSDDVIVTMIDGPVLMQSRGMEDFVAKPGELLVLSQAQYFKYTLLQPSTGWSMRLQHQDLREAIPDLEEAPLRAVPKRTPGMLLLRSYLHATARERFADQDTAAMAARHLRDLVALPIGRAEHRHESVEGAISSARRKVIEADMRANLGKPTLDLAWIAARQGVSARHIQRLFASQGTSFSDELRRMRLERALVILSDEANSSRTILSIAMDLGFVDASSFNRAFRRYFGFTPGEMRGRK